MLMNGRTATEEKLSVPAIGQYISSGPIGFLTSDCRSGELGQGIVDLESSIPRVPESSGLVLFERTAQEGANGRRRIRWKSGPVGLVLQDGAKRFSDRVSVECPPPCEYLIEQTTERPDVGTPVDGLPSEHLRAHVGRRPNEAPR